ncbi:unnamed protein product [Amoebophrya sp. A120]|nr:unnamed protein product [Amoebophrya sp. A120]|eukprot:GSA120T00007741001.1
MSSVSVSACPEKLERSSSPKFLVEPSTSSCFSWFVESAKRSLLCGAASSSGSGTTMKSSSYATVTTNTSCCSSSGSAVSRKREIDAAIYYDGKTCRDRGAATSISDKTHLFTLRQQFFAKKLSVSYANTNPLWIIRGEKQYLFDEKGTKYLDTRNNVAHVGHSHPRVVNAVCEQMKVLNTNTRYLHENMCRLAEKLLAYSNANQEQTSNANPPFDKVFFVNSGSEANDLALRLVEAYHARMRAAVKNCEDQKSPVQLTLTSGSSAAAMKTDYITVENGYHGHTKSVVDVSPYKFLEQKSNIHVLAQPSDLAKTQKSLQQLRSILFGVKGMKIAAMFIESGMSVGGVILPPDSYLREVQRMLKEKSALLVMDEVQVGLGRYGDAFWAWQSSACEAATGTETMSERQPNENCATTMTNFPPATSAIPIPQFCPDIITCGKPMGNGMPLACVITRQEIADSFEKEYFNTFGGNPVCCAAGLAVLETLEEENLMENARIVGAYLRKIALERLTEAGLQATSGMIDESDDPNRQLSRPQIFLSEVRGKGLFVGLEFVLQRPLGTAARKNIQASRKVTTVTEPATAATSALCAALVRDWQILTSIDGPDDNVLVVKPPMCFSRENCDYLVTAIASVLQEMNEELEDGRGENSSLLNVGLGSVVGNRPT